MATGVFILAVIAGILIFFECVQRAVQVNSQNTLKINVQRQSEHLRTILDINYQYLNEIASAMGRSEELSNQECFSSQIFSGGYQWRADHQRSPGKQCGP